VVDGIFGPMTRDRVMKFQTAAGHVADGIVGPKTAKALLGAVLLALK
jgi:peptidoglycan hydrolase-like protein with peptidoglycan-binding domain